MEIPLMRGAVLVIGLLGLFGILGASNILAQTQKVIVLDPGHCSNDKFGEKKVPENSLNLKQAAALGDLLSQNGYEVKIYNPSGDGKCNQDDYYENLQARVDFANDNKAAVFVSIHADSGEQSDEFNPIYSQKGPLSAESRNLAQNLCNSINKDLKISGKNITCKITESTQTGIGQSEGLEYYLLGPVGARTAGQFGGKLTSIQRGRNMPGVILENYMRTNQTYTDINPFINQIAQAYCNGIAQFLDSKDCGGSVGSSSSDATSKIVGKSNVVCTKVGNTLDPTPAACVKSSAIPGGGGIAGPDGFVFYCQGNTSWGGNCSLGSAGCGPTSLAMVLSTFGVNMNPPQVDSEFRKNGWRGCGDVGSTMTTALRSSWLKNLGFTAGPDLLNGNYLDIREAKKYLDEGYLIIASSTVFPCANCKIPGSTVNHIFVVDGADVNSGVVDIRDPNNCSYTDGNDEDPNKRVKGFTSFPWLYAIPIKKVS